MNVEISKEVGVSNFAGTCCLTDVLSDLPLPQPIPELVGVNRSLYFHPRISEECQRLLNCSDMNLASLLGTAISKAPCEPFVAKDNCATTEVVDGSTSALLQTILQYNPCAFSQADDSPAQIVSPVQNDRKYSLPGEASFGDKFPATASDTAFTVEDAECKKSDTDAKSGHKPPKFATPESPQAAKVPPTQTDDESFRKRIVSIGKQPKAAVRRKKDIVIELYDSLTPTAEYFEEGSRRRRRPARNYDERDTYEESVEEPKVETTDKRTTNGHDDDEASDDERPVTPTEVIRERDQRWREILKRKKEKFKRRSEKMPITDETELAENEIYEEFCSAVDSLMENFEDCDLSNKAAEDGELDLAECYVPVEVLGELCGNAQKLKAMNTMQRVSTERLTKLITLMERIVKDGEADVHTVEKLDRNEPHSISGELKYDRFSRSCEASYVVLTIMTSQSMPKAVYVEDVIDKIVATVHSQLKNIIYPLYDTTHRIQTDKLGILDKDGVDGPGVGMGAPEVDGHPPPLQHSSKRKGSKASSTRNKFLLSLYSRISDIIGALADLADHLAFTDTTIIQMSTLGIQPFFVDNVHEVQLSAMRLMANIFARYDKHRQIILEDILTSLCRLPISRRNLRTYRLDAEKYIQMVTALVMEVVQSVITVPSTGSNTNYLHDIQNKINSAKDDKPPSATRADDIDVVILKSYEEAVKIAHTFLSVYLKRCTTKSEDDFRVLFEEFIKDLLEAVYRPEWPSAELLLNVLGNLLVKNFSSKETDMTVRVASLDYLSLVATKLRRDVVTSSETDEKVLDEIFATLHDDDSDLNNTDSGQVNGDAGRRDKDGDVVKDQVENQKKPEEILLLQTAIVNYLAHMKNTDNAPEFARLFHVAQWYRDLTISLEKKVKSMQKVTDCDSNDVGKKMVAEQQKLQQVMQKAAGVKEELLALVHKEEDSSCVSKLKREKHTLSEEQASFAVRYLASKRPFSKSFDIYLCQILRVLNETSVALRSKAVKCLTAIVEVDPSVLGRSDIQKNVDARLLDQSSSVREAVVELLGKFITARPELIEKYYDMILQRILDTGVSVRKRVVKILKEIIENQPNFEKVPELCIRLMRRVTDEDSIKKLVCDSFRDVWFNPVRDGDTAALKRKVETMTDVVGIISREGGQFECFETLLSTLFKKDQDGKVHAAASQVVQAFVEHILTLEERLASPGNGNSNDNNNGDNYQRILFSLTTLYLFSRVQANLMVDHVEMLQPYLSMNCSSQGEQAVLVQVIRILEMVVPLMDHPSDSFLVQLEESLCKLMVKHGQLVVHSSISCLAVIINSHTKNYRLVQSAFQKFFGVMLTGKSECEIYSGQLRDAKIKATLLRAVFTVGLLCRFFDFDSYYPEDKRLTDPWKEQVCRSIMYFMTCDDDIRLKALLSLGFFCLGHPEFLMRENIIQLYRQVLTERSRDVRQKVQVLRNIEHFLKEEESKMVQGYESWERTKDDANLKELGETLSGLSSSVIQCYIREVLECYYHEHVAVRSAVSEVVSLTMQQGLIHPVQCIPVVIAMTTDEDSAIRTKAEKLLSEIGSKYAGFIQMKALDGMKQSYRFQAVATSTKTADVVRGTNLTDASSAANSYLYSLLRGSRQHRRGFLRSLLNMFDESANTDLAELVYVADNLSAFPYQTVDEPLFLIHHIDITVVVTASSIVQSFEEHLVPKNAPSNDDDSAADKEEVSEERDEGCSSILARLPEDLAPIENCVRCSQNCVLLLMLKQYLKELYGFTDARLQEYSPSEPVKSYDKAVMRRANLQFYPRYAIEYLTSASKRCFDDDHERRTWLCKHFIDFKQLLSSVDFTCNVDDDNDGAAKINSTMVQYSASVSIHSEETAGAADKCSTSASDDQAMFATSSTADEASTSSLVSDVVGPLLSTNTNRERIVLTIHRQDTSKLSRDNVYADFIRPYKSQKSSFAVPVTDRSATTSETARQEGGGSAGKKKKSVPVPTAKKKKRRRVVVDADTDSDDSDDVEYDPSLSL